MKWLRRLLNPRPVRVRIIYRSGAEQHFRCSRFTLSRSRLDGALTGAKWENARPDPMLIGVDDIVAVWTVGGHTEQS